jgi:putative ABC transport system permease protein
MVVNAFSFARRFLGWRAVTTWVLVFSLALGIGIVIALRSLPRALGAGAMEPAVRFPVLVGRGESASRLVLSTVFLEAPAPPPVPFPLLDRAQAAKGVAEAVPLRIRHEAGHPTVSTERAYFRLGETRLELSSGRYFEDDEIGEAVVGSRVALQQGLGPGDRVVGHGARMTVVGVLAETGTLLDEAIFSPLDAAEAALSAIVVVPGNGFDLDEMEDQLGQSSVSVVPVESTLRRITGMVAAVDRIVAWVSTAIAVLTAALILSSLYSSAREESRGLAILRVLGARRSTVLSVLVLEAAIIGVLGGLLGLMAGHAILATAASALSSTGFAFEPDLSTDALRVAGAGTLLAVLAGLAVGSSVYRIDPARVLEGVHRPWPEVLGHKGRARLRRLMLALVLLALLLPSSAYEPSPRSRLPDDASRQFFELMWKWDGEGPMPPEIAALDGVTLELEGYQYLPFDIGARREWRSGLFLVIDDPNHPTELFHGDGGHGPEANERVWVDLEQPIEATFYPIHVTGTFRISPGSTPAGDALYRLVGASARVIALPGD